MSKDGYVWVIEYRFAGTRNPWSTNPIVYSTREDARDDVAEYNKYEKDMPEDSRYQYRVRKYVREEK